MNIVKRVWAVSALSAVLAIAGLGMGGCAENPGDNGETGGGGGKGGGGALVEKLVLPDGYVWKYDGDGGEEKSEECDVNKDDCYLWTFKADGKEVKIRKGKDGKFYGYLSGNIMTTSNRNTLILSLDHGCGLQPEVEFTYTMSASGDRFTLFDYNEFTATNIGEITNDYFDDDYIDNINIPAGNRDSRLIRPDGTAWVWCRPSISYIEDGCVPDGGFCKGYIFQSNGIYIEISKGGEGRGGGWYMYTANAWYTNGNKLNINNVDKEYEYYSVSGNNLILQDEFNSYVKESVVITKVYDSQEDFCREHKEDSYCDNYGNSPASPKLRSNHPRSPFLGDRR